MLKTKDVVENKIIKTLIKNSGKGLTITELVDASKISRSAVRIALAKLEGANKVSIRKIGIAKVYSLNEENKQIKVVFFILTLFFLFTINLVGVIAINPLTGVVIEEQRDPNQLFDIKFELDSSIVLNLEDLVARVTFESFGTEPTQINLTFILLDEIGNQVYLGQDSLIVETENVFSKKFENADLEIGKYVILLNTIYNENVEDSFWKEFEIRSRVGKSPYQLFDIKIELEESLITDKEKLVTRVIFESFGTEPTPVDIEFIFLDESGEEIYREKDYIIVETEKVLTKEFKGSIFEEGEYTFVLRNLYNVDVEDEFRRKFEVKKEEKYRLIAWSSWVIIVFLLGFIFFVLRRQRRVKIKHGRK